MNSLLQMVNKTASANRILNVILPMKERSKERLEQSQWASKHQCHCLLILYKYMNDLVAEYLKIQGPIDEGIFFENVQDIYYHLLITRSLYKFIFKTTTLEHISTSMDS